LIEVVNVTKRYGRQLAVDHLSFTADKGQIYGFLGPNGAGKTTTMNMITGYLAATEGTITINGKDVQKEPEEAKKHIGYLPEMPPLYTDMTVEEYLKFVGELKKIPKQKRREQIFKVMEMTQITDMKGRMIKNLSKGYKQRVGLAQAIMGDPEMIILDEPTVGLDPKQIIEIRDLIRKLGEDHTVILSSHILSEVSAVCDHVMIISHGKLVASDSPEGLQKQKGACAQLHMEIKGEFSEVREVLSALNQVDYVEDKGKSKQGLVQIQVISKEGADVREDIFYALSRANLPIMSMSFSEKTLEDIFLELTADTADKVGTPMISEEVENAEEAAEAAAEVEEAKGAKAAEESEETEKVKKAEESKEE